MPVPPLPAVSAVARVSAPAELKEDVAVAPKEAVLPETEPPKSVVPVAFVVVSPPANERSVVVELPTNG